MNSIFSTKIYPFLRWAMVGFWWNSPPQRSPLPLLSFPAKPPPAPPLSLLPPCRCCSFSEKSFGKIHLSLPPLFSPLFRWRWWSAKFKHYHHYYWSLPIFVFRCLVSRGNDRRSLRRAATAIIVSSHFTHFLCFELFFADLSRYYIFSVAPIFTIEETPSLHHSVLQSHHCLAKKYDWWVSSAKTVESDRLGFSLKPDFSV